VNSEFRVDLDTLIFKKPVTAGINVYRLMSLIPLLRETTLDHEAILVGPVSSCCGHRVILDGRHRVMASIAAGRPDILAVEEEPWCCRP
jgi:hypothetical protein